MSSHAFLIWDAVFQVCFLGIKHFFIEIRICDQFTGHFVGNG